MKMSRMGLQKTLWSRIFWIHQIQHQKTYFCKKSHQKSSKNVYNLDEGIQKKEQEGDDNVGDDIMLEKRLRSGHRQLRAILSGRGS